MFCEKTNVRPKISSINVCVDDFSKGLNFNKGQNISSMKSCVSVFNFDFSDGVLTESYGLKNFSCPNYQDDTVRDMEQGIDDPVANLENVWFFKMYDESNGGRVDKLMFYGDNGYIYYSRIITKIPLLSRYIYVAYNDKPTFNYNIKLNGVDYVLFGSEKLGVYKFDGGIPDPVLLENFPLLNSMCENNNMLFGSGYGERNIVFYHHGLDFDLWTTDVDDKNGKIELNDARGKINKVISYLGYVFLIRDFGISKVLNFEEGETPEIVHLNLTGSQIFENTAQVCRDKMIMLTKDGICSFNGTTNEILDLEVNKLLEGVNNEKAVSVFHSGKYYLACRLNFNDGNIVGCESETDFVNNALIVLNVETKQYEILRGIDIASMCSVQLNLVDKIAIILNKGERQRVFELDRSGKFYSDISQKMWISPLTDLGYSNKFKIVKNFSVLTKFDCFVTIFTEKDSKTFALKGSETLNKIKVNLKGKQIGVKIESLTEKAYISNLNFNVDLIDYGYKN